MIKTEISQVSRGEPSSAQRIHVRGGKRSEELARWTGCSPESLKGAWALVSFSDVTRWHQKISLEQINARFLRRLALVPIGNSALTGMTACFLKTVHPGMSELHAIMMGLGGATLGATQILLWQAGKCDARKNEIIANFREKIPEHYRLR